jgi:hypothetical protein
MSDAAQLYRDGQAAYDQAHYGDAIAAWQKSYALSRAPALLYNIAQALRLRSRPGDCGAALARYREFVALVEPSPQREIAERYIAELGTCSSASALVSEPRPAPQRSPMRPSAPSQATEDRDTGTHVREITVVAIAVGGLGSLVTGVALGHHASSLGDEVTSACDVSCDWSAEKSKDAAGHRDSALGWTFGTLGAVVLVGDTVLYYFGIRERGVGVAPIGSQLGAAATWSRTW